jgi:hypothetical protein
VHRSFNLTTNNLDLTFTETRRQAQRLLSQPPQPQSWTSSPGLGSNTNVSTPSSAFYSSTYPSPADATVAIQNQFHPAMQNQFHPAMQMYPAMQNQLHPTEHIGLGQPSGGTPILVNSTELPPLNQADYLLVTYWHANQWREVLKKGKTTIKKTKRGKATLRDNENVRMYLQDEHGVMAQGERCAEILDYVRPLLHDQTHALKEQIAISWGQAGATQQQHFYHAIESRFFEF